MRTLLHRGSAVAFGTILLAAALSGCAVSDGAYAPGFDDSYDYGGVGVGIGFDYYEPYGAYYGGWGPSYHVAPYRGSEPHWDRGAARGSPHPYRSAPESRPMPSIPSHSRSGGTRNERR